MTVRELSKVVTGNVKVQVFEKGDVIHSCPLGVCPSVFLDEPVFEVVSSASGSVTLIRIHSPYVK